MLIKIIILILLLFTGFVCGGAVATRMYSKRLEVMGRYTDKAMNDSTDMFDRYLACKTTMEMGR